jgi:aerobic-type carbon monoxide dehydrogenase small subunit (CoxS/CutS family)
MRADVDMSVNGTNVTLDIDVRTTLADALRDHLGLTGTHLGCEQGVCGSCTVLADGQSIRSCLALAVACDGKAIITIEGFTADERFVPIRDAFARHHALQCGFCTPGILATVAEMVTEGVAPYEEVVRDRLAGNLCRCTGYQNIVSAATELLGSRATGESQP